MLIEIVKFTDGNFSRVTAQAEDIDTKLLNSHDVIAYRFMNGTEDPKKNVNIYDWNLSSELKSALSPLPVNLTPELLYIFRNDFLAKAVELFEILKSGSKKDDSEIYDLIYRFCSLFGKPAVLFDEELGETFQDFT